MREEAENCGKLLILLGEIVGKSCHRQVAGRLLPRCPPPEFCRWFLSDRCVMDILLANRVRECTRQRLLLIGSPVP